MCNEFVQVRSGWVVDKNIRWGQDNFQSISIYVQGDSTAPVCNPPQMPSFLSTAVPPRPTPCGAPTELALPQQDAIMTISGKEQFSIYS